MSDADHLTLERLAARIGRQEGYMKGLRWSIPGLMIVLLSLMYGFQSPTPPTAETVTAKNLAVETVVVRNAKGEIVALMSSTTDGTPQISLFDAQKKVRLSIGLRSNGGPSVSLFDPEQGARAELSLNDQQDPSLTMSNAAKLPRAAFSIDTVGSGHVVLYGAGGGLSLSASDGGVRWTPVAGGPLRTPPPKNEQ